VSEPSNSSLLSSRWSGRGNALKFRKQLARLTASISIGALAACTTDKYSFVRYGQTVDPNTGQYDSRRDPQLSDVVALNYASSVVTILRAKYTGARITREVSSTAQLGLAAASAYGAAFNYSKSTLAVLGLASAGIPELQRLFGAKERAQMYQDAIRLIEEAEIEYLALNQRPSATLLTQNGVTLFQRVTASIHLVEKTLAGNLPSATDMQKATERMSETGAKKTAAGATPSNLVPADGSAPVKKLAPVIIEKTVLADKELQPEQVRAITAAAGAILRKSTPAQAQAVAEKLGISVANSEDPREALSQILAGSAITAPQAADILSELQKQVPQ
jgi:hypothetical protein